MAFLNPIGSLMSGVLTKLGVTERNYAIAALVERELAQVSPRARVVGFKNNRLYVEVDSPVELQELCFRRREILKTMRSAIPAQALEEMPELKFFVKGLAHPGVQDRMRTPAAPSKPVSGADKAVARGHRWK